VAAEIANLGGQAVASYDDALNGAAIIKTAIDAFGRVDILITNMGMIKDQTLLKMTEAGWNDVMQANMQTAVNIIRAAWPYMKKQRYGRIITVNSGSAMFGSFGQVNYSAAKGALYGLSKSLAKEGENDNIKVNILIPMAATNMTKAHFPPDHVPTFGPEKVAPVAVILAHEKCPGLKEGDNLVMMISKPKPTPRAAPAQESQPAKYLRPSLLRLLHSSRPLTLKLQCSE